MARSMALAQFLGHQSRAGGGGQFLRGWRKRQPPQVKFVLHRHAPIVALWQHSLFKLFEQKDEKKRGSTIRVFGQSFNCLEAEEVLLKQYQRDKHTDERTLPPVICPFCRMLEAIRDLYKQNEIGFCEPIFRWEGDDPNETATLTYGGMLSLYGRDNLTDEEKQAMDDAGIRLTEAWKEAALSKCNYLFCLVDVEEPEAGVQIAIETTLLGDVTKEAIHSQMKSLGTEDGNPLENPYVIQWEHLPNAREFNKRYKAYPLQKYGITDEVAELINGDPPDISRIVKPGNVTRLRAELEAQCCLDDPSIIPWDDIFSPAEEAGFGDDEAAEAGAEDTADGDPAEAIVNSAPARRRVAAQQPPAEEEEEEEEETEEEGEEEETEDAEEEGEEEEGEEETGEPCDQCGAAMAVGAMRCEACGAEYEAVPDDPPAAAPAKAAKPAPKPATLPAAKPAAKPAATAGTKPAGATKPAANRAGKPATVPAPAGKGASPKPAAASQAGKAGPTAATPTNRTAQKPVTKPVTKPAAKPTGRAGKGKIPF